MRRCPKALRILEKKGQLARGSKKHVVEQVSLSKMTRATKGVTPK